MNIFESELKKGKFMVGECLSCQKITWPPSNSCSRCFGNLSWREVKEPGTLIEYSIVNDTVFGIVEFEKNIRIIGEISGKEELKEGQKIRILRCSYNDSPKYLFGFVQKPRLARTINHK